MHLASPSHTHGARWTAGLAALALLAFLSACRSLPIPGLGESSLEQQRARELRSLLDRYTRDFAEIVEQAADEIVDSTTDLRVGRATVYWKLKMIPRARELSRTERQGEALLGLWLYTEAMGSYFEVGEGREVFGDAQPIALAACRRLSEEVAAVARKVLESEEGFAQAEAVIRDYVQRYAAGRRAGRAPDFVTVEEGIKELTGKAGVLEWMPSFSLEAFNPFSGLNESAAAIRDFTDRASLLVDDVSTELPWQLELLLYDIEERETVRGARASFERAADSAASLARTAAAWPADVEEVIQTTLAELDDSQVGLRRTLQQTLDALVEARTLVSGLNQTAANLTAAGEAWDGTFQTLGFGGEETAGGGSGSEPAEPEEETRPFDILEYRDTAEELRKVAVELRGLVGDVHALTAESGEDTPLGNIEVAAQTAAAAAAGEGRALVDHIALRLIQLVGVICLAALVYRVVASRIGRHSAAGS